MPRPRRKRVTRPKGSIRKRENGMYEARLPYSVDKKRSVVETSTGVRRFKTVKEAEEAMEAAITAIQRRERVTTTQARKGLTVTQLCERYVEERRTDPDAPLATNTIIGYKAAIERSIKNTNFGKMRIGRVTAPDVNKWLRELADDGVPQSRRNYAKRVVSAAFSWGAGEGLMPVVSLASARKRSSKFARHKENIRGTVMLPTWKQFADIVCQPDRWEDRLLIALLGWSGLRWGEARSLQTNDFNGDGTIRVERTWVKTPKVLTGTDKTSWNPEPVKAGNPRDVLVPSGLLQPLAELTAMRGSGLLFRADQRKSRGGRQILLSSNFRQRIWLPAIESAGLGKPADPKDRRALKIKDLRAFAASVLVDSGATTVETAALLRNDPATSERFYIRPTLEGDPDRFRLRMSVEGSTMRERLDYLYVAWAARFPLVTERLALPEE